MVDFGRLREPGLKIKLEQAVNWRIRWMGCLLLGGILLGCGQTPVTETPRHEETRPTQNAEHRNSDRYDLQRDEDRGGHTLARHVARTDEQLAERLRKERNISAASTWTNREIAEETVAAGLRAEQRRIDSWMRRGERRPNLALHYNAGQTIGRSLRRGETESVPCTGAVIVLRADGSDGFYVLTTYPEARE
jgi:Bacterial CdiA-CT RNAse A domain